MWIKYRDDYEYKLINDRDIMVWGTLDGDLWYKTYDGVKYYFNIKFKNQEQADTFLYVLHAKLNKGESVDIDYLKYEYNL